MSSISSVSSSMSSSMLKQMQEEMFKKADANNDSSISKDEFSAMSKSEDSKSSSDAATMFAQFDTDSDGALSRLESDAAIAKAGQEMQSQGARPQGPPPGPPPSEESETSSSDSSDVSAIFDEMDTNQDGVVSLAEMTAALDSSEESESATDPKTLLDTISTALESGDTTTAQAALATLQVQQGSAGAFRCVGVGRHFIRPVVSGRYPGKNGCTRTAEPDGGRQPEPECRFPGYGCPDIAKHA